MNTVGPVVIVLLVLTSIHLWIGALRCLRAHEPLVPREPRREVPWGLLDILMALILEIVAVRLAGLWGGPAFHVDLSRPLEQLDIEQRARVLMAFSVARLATLTLTIAWLLARYRPSAHDFGVDLRRIGSDLGLGIRAFVMLAPILYGVQFLLVQVMESKHPLIELLKDNPSSQFFAMSGFAAVIVAPVAEEFFFRLLVQGWLERLAVVSDPFWKVFVGGRPAQLESLTASEENKSNRTASATAIPIELVNPYEAPGIAKEDVVKRTSYPRHLLVILASSLLFALAHASNGPDPIPLFVLALGLGYLYQRTHRIVPCIVVHLLLNLCTVTMLWFVVQQG